MQTFELELTGEWQEVLQGKAALAFDLVQDASISVFFNESDVAPTTEGNPVASWPSGWDFSVTGMIAPTQRIWVTGIGIIRGVR